MEGIVISILWFTISGLLLFQNAEACAQLPPKNLFWVVVIFMIGGPVLALAAIIEAILDTFLPDGWNGDDDDDFKGY